MNYEKTRRMKLDPRPFVRRSVLCRCANQTNAMDDL